MEVDGLRIGIRAQDAAHQGWLSELLGDRVLDDADVAPNYSVRVSDDPKLLHLLYWGGCLVARCRTKADLVAAIDAHLGGHGPVPQGVVRLSGLAVRRADDAVVLTQVDQQYGAKLGARLRTDGITIDVRPWVDVDTETGTLRPPGSVGLARPDRATPGVRAVFLAAALAELPLGDRVMAMQRSGVVDQERGTLAATVAFVRSMLTERVDNFAVADVAEGVRRRFANHGRFDPD